MIGVDFFIDSLMYDEINLKNELLKLMIEKYALKQYESLNY